MKTNLAPAKKNNSNKGLIIVLGALVLTLGGYSGYLYDQMLSYEKVLLTQQEVENSTKIENILFDIECNMLAYELLSSNYAELGLENESIQNTIADLAQEIENWKSRTWSSKAELRVAKKDLDDKLAAIRLDLIVKTDEVERLESVNTSFASSMDSLIEINGQNSEDIKSLSEKVEIASILKTEDLAIIVLSKKDKIIKEVYKEKNIDKIKVHFNLADNKIAKHDLKSLVLQIIEPSGSVLFDIEHGGGSFSKANGHNDFYTKKQVINFTNTHQSVDFFYEKGDLMEPGTYQVIVSSDNHEIGATSFVVK